MTTGSHRGSVAEAKINFVGVIINIGKRAYVRLELTTQESKW